MYPKDKVEDSKNAYCIDEIPCKICSHTYIGETAITFGARFEEHKKEVKRDERR